MEISPPKDQAEQDWLKALWVQEWGGETMVSKGVIYRLAELGALIARGQDGPCGAATYHVGEHGCELMSINALAEGQGVGTSLLRAVEELARNRGCSRVWLITTNDNLDALRFYQRRGYRLAALYPGAVDEARKQKPAIPLVGYHGIPIRDEIELEKAL